MEDKIRILLVLVVVLSFLSSPMFAQKEKTTGMRGGYISSNISKAEVDWLEDFDDGYESFYLGFFKDTKKNIAFCLHLFLLLD